MRLCVPIPCFFGDMPFQNAVGKVAGLGFDAAEIYHWDTLDIDAAGEALVKNGVSLISMCTTEFRLTDPAFSGLWLEGLGKTCEAARRLGAGKILTQVGQDTGAPREYQHEAIVSTLSKAVPVLEEYGMTVMIEPLNTLVNHRGYYLPSSAEAFDIVREVGSDSVKVVFDIYHQQISEGNIIPNIVNSLPLIAHLHAAGHPGRHELQSGENDYKVIFRAVDEAGYKGACGLEYTPLTDPSESLRTAAELYGS